MVGVHTYARHRQVYARCTLPDMEAAEELFIKRALVDIPLSLHDLLVKTELEHLYTHKKNKRSSTTAVLQAFVPKTITAPQAKQLV